MMIFGTMQNKTVKKKVFNTLAAAVIWLGVWSAVYLFVGEDVLIASPWSVAIRLFELLGEKEFYIKIFNSIYAVLKGYFLAIVSGCLLAVITAESEFLFSLFKPVMNVVRATPVASFIILALVWMSKKSVPVFTSFLMVFPIVWANITTGIKSTDKKLLEMAKAYKVPEGKIILNVYIPSVMPEFYNSITTGLGFAWKSGVAAEVLSTPVNTIGTELYNSKVYLETVDLFSWTVVIILLSMILEKAAVYILGKIFSKMSGGDLCENNS